ncbi:MAG: insulinase family protein [Anaerolineae bacterium]
MSSVHGFELIEERTIPELNARARLYRHIRTGAELLSVENDDENKVFGVNFKTPPPDSTGLPHIMEHSVLGGSRKYPVKEPFVELLKSSLNTFLNAMTFSDMTVYPVASTNLKDFYNLVDVYLDAVFYPRISEKTLQQEGWHYELESKDGPLTYKGIVFNEMKGAYSSPENVLARYTEQLLLPDTPYGYDSGGDPAVIPDLTYEQFKQFHATYYHPSNARFWFYGDDDPEERLRLVDAFIAEFDRIEVNADVPRQPRFDAPRRATLGYDAGEDAEDSKRGMVTVSWLLSEAKDVEQSLGLSILSHILVETPASPLRKALIDSGLGEDLVGGGLSPFQRELYFATGLKGIDPADADRVETLIMDTLAELVRDGIDPDMIEAAMNTVEFQLRENNTGSYPRGLALMLAALPAWLHGGNPLDALAFEAPLNRIKTRVADGRYFEDLIQQFFLSNPHRSTLIMVPDPTVRPAREAAEQERLAKIRARMTDADLEAVMADAEELRRIQETPDPPEALATIPTLTRADLDREIKRIPREVIEGDGTILYHDLFTNGIAYLDVAFDLHTLPADLLPLVPLFGRALLEMGTETEDFVKLSQRIGRKTGGIEPTTLISPIYGDSRAAAWLVLRGKAMASQTQDLLDILRDVLLTVQLDNPTRFRQMVLEEKTGLESMLVPRGHLMVLYRLRAQYGEPGWVAEQLDGISQLFFLRDLVEAIDSDWAGVLEKLETIRRMLVNRAAMLFNVTLDSENWAQFQPQLAGFIGGLPAGSVAQVAWERTPQPAFEGLTIPAQVNYVAKGGNLYDLGYQLHGSHVAVTNFLNMTWLWERIRAQGGAYGGFCAFEQSSGLFGFMSYRDPNLLATLDNYDGAADFLRGLQLSEDDLTRAIIGAIGRLDAYLLPDAKGYRSMSHYLTGYTEDMQQKLRDEVLNTTSADFNTFGEALARLRDSGTVVVMGSPEAINAANTERDNFLQVTKVL